MISIVFWILCLVLIFVIIQVGSEYATLLSYRSLYVGDQRDSVIQEKIKHDASIKKLSRRICIFLAIVVSSVFTAGKLQHDRALYMRMKSLEERIDLPLHVVSENLIDIAAETGDADLRFFASNAASALDYYSGTGIKSFRDFSEKGAMGRLARGLLQVFVDPGKLINGIGSGLRVSYNVEETKAALIRLESRYGGFNYFKWVSLLIIWILSAGFMYIKTAD